MSIILFSDVAYKKFLKFVLENANPYSSRYSWKEVIGFLFGTFPDATEDQETEFEVIVTDVLPMDSGSAAYVKIGDYTPAFPVISQKMETNEFIVGWIHSHPGLGIFLSGTDIRTQNIYQNMDKRAIAIVVDQTTIINDFSGMKCFRLTDNTTYDEIPIVVEKINNFSVVYREMLNEILPELKILPPAFSNESKVEINDIRLNLVAPKTWNFDEKQQIPVLFYYSSEQDGFIKIVYKIHISGGKLAFQNQKYIRHLAYNPGLLAAYQIICDEPKKQKEIQIKLEEITLRNNKNEIITLDSLDLVIQSQ